MRLAELRDRLDEELRVGDYAGVDASANGLQVGPRDAAVETVAFAVDAALATIEDAAAAGADLLVVHHGLVWDGLERVTGRAYDRIAALLEADLALYVAHLPLDGHQSLGNAAGVADLLGLTDRAPFGDAGGEPIGVRGTLAETAEVDELAALLAASLDTGGQAVRVLDFGPAVLEDVAVLTGAGADFFDAAVASGVDAFVTGEGKGRLYHEAREAGVHVLLAGHYATETAGVRALADLVAGWGPETTFLDHPTGL
ncbi:MAG: Nif3-like dinuclear metal center hexameric protein [Halobacteriaceae archaeon]